MTRACLETRVLPSRSLAFLAWGAAGLTLILAPLFLNDAYSITLMSHMCAMAVFALSYNLLLGQTGLLSFGHAIYAGMGGWVAVKLLGMAEAGGLLAAWPVSAVLWLPLVPLLGGLGGAAFGLLFAHLTTRRGGTPFAMISLGVGELTYAIAAMFPGWFGGEAGISADRVVGAPIAGISFGPDIEVYYLTAAWTFVAVLAMYGLTCTPLGRMARAVRDNAQRVGFIGYDARRVRSAMLIAAAFFAGMSGALTALIVEVVSAESLGSSRSAMVLLAVVIGGSARFIGPVLGAIAVVMMSMALSRHTPAWQLYLGLAFAATVMFVPGGMAGWLTGTARAFQGVRRAGRWRDWLGYQALGALGLVAMIAGAIGVIEPAYQDRLRLGQVADGVVAGSGVAMWVAGLMVVCGAVMAWAGQRGASRLQTPYGQGTHLEDVHDGKVHISNGAAVEKDALVSEDAPVFSGRPS